MALALGLFSGALLSATVELIQLFAPHRNASIIDLITNTFGSSVGAFFGWPWARWGWPRLSVYIRQLLLARPVMGCAVATSALLLIAGMAPFHVTLAPAAVKASLKAARPIPFGRPLSRSALPPERRSWAAELLTWTLAGGLFGLAARESGRRGLAAIGESVAAAGGLGLAIEAIQVLVPEREVDMTSVALALFGSALGAWLVVRARSNRHSPLDRSGSHDLGTGRRRVRVEPPDVCVAHPAFMAHRAAGSILVLFRQPHSGRPGGRGRAGDRLCAAGRAPGRALLAAVFPGAVLAGLALGTLLEIGQLFVPRTVDISDAVSAAAGAGLGWAVWRWGEWARTSSTGVVRYRVGRRAGIPG